MKKFFVVFCLILSVFSKTIVLATKENINVKRGDEYLKDSLSKWEEVGDKSITEMFGEFFKKGSPTLSQADKNRLIINLLIFSCIANVGICIYILKKDKKEIETIVNTDNKEFRDIDGSTKRNTINIIKQVDKNFSTSQFIKEVKNQIVLLEEARNSRNIDAIKSLGTKEFSAGQEKELKDSFENGLVEKSENVKAKGVEIVRFFSGKELDTIVVIAKVNKIQYWTNLDEDKILKGNRKIPVDYYYKMSFVRSKEKLDITDNVCACPACGAEGTISDNQQFKCYYCGYIGYTKWTLNLIKQLTSLN